MWGGTELFIQWRTVFPLFSLSFAVRALNSFPLCPHRRRKKIQPTLQSVTNRMTRPKLTQASLLRTAPTSPCLRWRTRSVDEDQCVEPPMREPPLLVTFLSSLPPFILYFHCATHPGANSQKCLPRRLCRLCGCLWKTSSFPLTFFSSSLSEHGLLELPYFLTHKKNCITQNTQCCL